MPGGARLSYSVHRPLASAAISARFLGRNLADDGIGAPKTLGRDRNAGVNSGLQENFRNLLRRHAVVQRTANVHLELMPSGQRRQHADVEYAAGLARQTLAQPHISPALRLRELDEILG